MRQILVPAVCTALVSIGPALAEEIDHRRGEALLQSRRRGIYLYRIQAANFSASKRMMLLK